MRPAPNQHLEGVDVELVTWDLAPLLAIEDGGTVGQLLDAAEEGVSTLVLSRGKVASFDAEALATFMTTLAEVQDLMGRAESYAELRHVADTTDQHSASLWQHVADRISTMEAQLLFFNVEWAALPDEQSDRLLADPRLDGCRQHLRRARRQRLHLLSEAEERVLAESAPVRRDAWCQLAAELIGRGAVVLGDESLALDGALSRLASAQADVRRSVAKAIDAHLAPDLETKAFVLDTLVHGKAIEDRLRGFGHWLASRNLENEVSDASVDALIAAVLEHRHIPQRWYRAKARMLGLQRLHHHDRVATLDDHRTVGWQQAREIVVSSYASLDKGFGVAAARFFEERWIDASVRPGKRSGAFCSWTVPSAPPYVSLKFTGQRRDVLRLAHEVGHGIHALLAARQGVFHYLPSVPMAEAASVVGEMLVLQRLLDECDTTEARVGLLGYTVDQMVSNVFMQVAMHRFEHELHTFRRENDALSVDDLGRLWLESQAEMFGDSVDVAGEYQRWWSLVTHVFVAPGYLYSYAYGQLLALALFERSQEGGPDAVASLIEMLSLGGAESPATIAAVMGIDLADPWFWARGLEVLERHVAQVEKASRGG